MTALTKVPGVRASIRVAVAIAAVLAVLQLASGPSRGDTGTFANYTNLNTDSETTRSRVPADLYPSPITVSGLSGTVTRVSVTLNNFTTDPESSDGGHYPDDADILLAAPDASHNLVVMSDVGGDNTVSHPVDHATLVIDDDAPSGLPINGTDPWTAGSPGFTSGHYKPTDDDSDQYACPPCGPDEDFWGAPAPPPSTATTMAQAFNGISPNGTWDLYAWDDAALANYHLYGGWCINITTDTGSTTSGTCSVPTTSPPGATTTVASPTTTTTTGGATTTTTTTVAPTTTTTAAPTTTTTAAPTTTTTVPTVPTGTSVFPSTVKVSTGTATGSAASLTADDNNYYVDKSSTKVTSWYGTFNNVPRASAKSLRVTYVGKQSQNASQVVYVYRYSTKGWVAVNTTNPVGTSEMTISVALTGSPTDWMSSTGQMKIRVKSTATSGALTTSADLLSVSYTT